MYSPNFPFGIEDVPDRVLGTKKVIHQKTGVIVRKPGGREGGLVRERTVKTKPSPYLCEPNSFPVVQRPPHLDVSFEGEYAHPQVCATIGGSFEVNGAPVAVPVTTDINLFQVPESLTLFVEKWLLQQFNADFESLQFIPLLNGRAIRGLIPGTLVPFPNVHLPTLPQGQRNTRWEYGTRDVVGIRLINSSGGPMDVCISFLGWVEKMKCADLVRRK